jgi:rare lipoprotein A
MKLLAHNHSPKRSANRALLVLASMLVLAGCGHKPVTVAVPSAPPQQQKPEGTPPVQSGQTQSPPEIEVPADAKPLLVETGIASWYGAPYHNRRGSNGEIYDMHAMTAAHRTLPLGSIVRVTNPANGNSVIVRITDRGPFIAGRIIDLSKAAAEQIGLVQKGTAEVRVEVLKTPAPIEAGGRWAVQIGGFEKEEVARDLAGHLSHRYHTARVLTFDSPAGDWWVRVRVKNDLRARAEEILRDTKTREGGIFLVRLD